MRSWELKGTPPNATPVRIRPYQAKPMVNSPSTRPYFPGVALGGVPLDSHEIDESIDLSPSDLKSFNECSGGIKLSASPWMNSVEQLTFAMILRLHKFCGCSLVLEVVSTKYLNLVSIVKLENFSLIWMTKVSIFLTAIWKKSYTSSLMILWKITMGCVGKKEGNQERGSGSEFQSNVGDVFSPAKRDERTFINLLTNHG